jgi:hypothetical protein
VVAQRLIDGLSERFSNARIEPYLSAARGDAGLAVRLYDWNIRIGAALFEDLGIIEILLRNTLDGALRNHYQTARDRTPWYDRGGVLFTSGYELTDKGKEGCAELPQHGR